MKSGDLQFNDTAHLKFSHNSEGVIAKYKNKKFILGYLSILKERTDLTDEEYIKIALIEMEQIWLNIQMLMQL